MNYYYYGCKDNAYYYKHINAVLLSDFHNFLVSVDNNYLDNIFSAFDVSKNNGKIVSPLMQLMFVLPPKSYHLLPVNVEYALLNNKFLLIKLFNMMNRKTLKRDFLFKTKLHQCQIVMNVPDIEMIRLILSNIHVYKSEAKRNLMF